MFEKYFANMETGELINLRIESLNYLKSSDLPIVLYGAGDYALAVERFLMKYGLAVSSKFVDSQYENNDSTVHIDEIEKKYKKYNVVIGMANSKFGYESIKRKGSLKIDRVHHFVLSPLFLDSLDFEFFDANYIHFRDTYEMLSDDASKRSFLAFIKTQLTGDDQYLIKESCPNQYFQGFMKITDKEVFVDCGAYIGDTLRDFYRYSKGRYLKYYAFEPDQVNFDRLSSYVKQESIENVQLYCSGLGSKKEILRFSGNGDKSRISKTGDVFIKIDTLDEACSDATFIKIDIEGAELEALIGAERTVVNLKPKLAIAAYHKPSHLFEIPKYVKSILPEYQLFFRQHQKISTDLVLYART